MTVPSFGVEAIVQVLSGAPDGMVLDPWATDRGGVLLASVLESLTNGEAVALARTEREREHVERSLSALQASVALVKEWPEEEGGLPGLSHDQQVSRIVSFPPWGLKPPGNDAPPRIRRGALVEVMAAAGARLTPQGLGVFVVTEAEFLRGGGVERLADRGVRVEQVLALPSGTFAPFTSLGGALVVVSRGEPGEIYVGQLSSKLDANRQVVAGVRGTHVLPQDFHGVEAAVARVAFSRATASCPWPDVPLGHLIKQVNRGRFKETFEPVENAVYLPIIGRADVHHRLGDLTMKHQNYAQLIVRQEQASPPWLAGYLGSPTGLLARRTMTNAGFIPRLRSSSIEEIPVLVLPLGVQDRMVRADQSLRMQVARLTEWRAELWGGEAPLVESETFIDRQEESFSDWVSHLPFPLATILWTYHAAGDNARARYEHLLHFFEAAAEFHATVLLSAVVNDEQGSEMLAKTEQALKGGKLSFEMATFGTWKTVFSTLAKQLRSLYTDTKEGGRQYVEGALLTHDRAVLEMLLSKGVAAVFESTNHHRNNWKGHGGVVGTDEAERRHSALRDDLVTYREAIGGGWSNYELVVPISMTHSGGLYPTQVQDARGATTPFTSRTVEVASPMETGRLHLIGSGEPEALPLLPLIKLLASPKSAANACYFYNRREGEESRFVSYHFDQEAEVTRAFPEVDATINRLSGLKI